MIQNISKYNINNSLDINFKENLVELKGFFICFSSLVFPTHNSYSQCTIYTQSNAHFSRSTLFMLVIIMMCYYKTPGRKKIPIGLPAIIHIVDMKELTSFTYQCHWFRVGNVCMGRVRQLSLRKKHQVDRSVI